MYRRFAALFLCLMVVSAQHHLTAARGDEEGAPSALKGQYSKDALLSEGQERLLKCLDPLYIDDKITREQLDRFQQHVVIVEDVVKHTHWDYVVDRQEKFFEDVNSFLKKNASKLSKLEKTQLQKHCTIGVGRPDQSLRVFWEDLQSRKVGRRRFVKIFRSFVNVLSGSHPFIDEVRILSDRLVHEEEMLRLCGFKEMPPVALPRVQNILLEILNNIESLKDKSPHQDSFSKAHIDTSFGCAWKNFLHTIQSQDCSDFYAHFAYGLETYKTDDALKRDEERRLTLCKIRDDQYRPLREQLAVLPKIQQDKYLTLLEEYKHKGTPYDTTAKEVILRLWDDIRAFRQKKISDLDVYEQAFMRMMFFFNPSLANHARIGKIEKTPS